MSKGTIRRLATLVMAGSLFMDRQSLAAPSEPTFAIGEQDFLLSSQPFVIRSGEMHYPRIPREYWPHRLRLARALGLNTVSTYVFWNLHQPSSGHFDFSGNADVAEFCRLAQREGLRVIIRPGPYVCAEWDFGGLPSWLLKDANVRVRTRNPAFLEACKRYFMELGKQLAPLQITKGGPIIMVQVENEYGNYASDARYLATLRDYVKEAGFEVPLFTHDTSGALSTGKVEGLFRSVGMSGKPEDRVAALRAVQPTGPVWGGELYSGWFESWGRTGRRAVSADDLTNRVRWMIEHNVSFNIYMAHGGTSFGFSSGAVSPVYTPETTSYDYGAPISEAGWDTPKYHALRELLSKHLASGETLPAVPTRNPVIQIPPVELTEVSPLMDQLAEPRKESRAKSMEAYGQAHGSVLYRTKLPAGGGERLLLRELHDYGLIYLDGRRIGNVERWRQQDSIALPNRENESTLDLLVTAYGRVNSGTELSDRKGIAGDVRLVKGGSPHELTGWEVFNLPMDEKHLSTLKFQRGKTNVPAFYRGRFNLREVGDTFLDMRTWGQGVGWINGHNLGRFWSIGPQQTLYCPAPWLKRGANELIVFDLEGAQKLVVAGLAEPILNQLNFQATGERLHRKPGQTLKLETALPLHEGAFAPGGGWQTVKFIETRGRYLCLEALTPQAESAVAACAELILIKADGTELARDNWKIVYADSEEIESNDGSASNLLDSQPGSFWHTQWTDAKPEYPHQVVIDLGREETIKALRYLPRQDSTSGRIKAYRLLMSSTPLVEHK